MIRYNLFFFAIISLILISCDNKKNESADYEEPTAAVVQPAAPVTAQSEYAAEPAVAAGTPIYLNTEGFLTQVHNFKASRDWNFLGDKPAIIDFYADWCKPCKMVAPFLEELAEEYEGQVNIYKVNIDNEPDIAAFYGISSIPTFFFIKADGNASAGMGYKPKEFFEEQILNLLQ